MLTTEAISHQIFKELKEFIDLHKVDGFQEYTKELLYDTEFQQPPDWPWIFNKLFIHACSKNERDIAKWVRQTFDERVDAISKIAYKHSFAYGDTLLRRRGN